jgi:hypothetical protein
MHKNFTTRKLSAVRQTVERAIGHLKGRFRRLRDLYCMRVDDCCYIITSACILRNLCISKNDDLDDYLQRHADPQENRVNNYSNIYRNDNRGV